MESAGQMSKYSVPSVNSINSVDKVETIYAPKYKLSFKAVRLLIDAKVIAAGYVTGNSYKFNGAGSVVDVDERDVENLVNKRQGGRQCCGGTGHGNAMFELA